MMYNYSVIKKEILTDEGQRRFLKVRDKVKKLLLVSAAFRMGVVISYDTNSFFSMACVDRMVEIGELREVGHYRTGQFRTFIDPSYDGG